MVPVPTETNVLKPWTKGGPSPNPRGRGPDKYGVERLARDHSVAAITRLIAFAMGDLATLNRGKKTKQERLKSVPIEVQMRACDMVLNRAIGKPTETLRVDEDAKVFVMRMPIPDATSEEWERRHSNGSALN